MTHDQIAELLGAYALHALDPDERALVEEHLATCPRCRAEVQDHEQTAALLGNSGGAAPDGVWDRIVSTLEEAPPPMRLALDGGRARVVPLDRQRRVRRWATAAVGVAAAIAIGLLGTQVVQQGHRIDDLQATLATQAPSRALELALVTPGALRARLASTDGTLAVPAVVLPDGTGYLVADEMPALDDGLTYQLWGQAGGRFLSLGVLGASPRRVVTFQAGTDVTALAITQERDPGVAQPSQAPLVAGRLD